MNKAELIEKIAADTGMTKVAAAETVESMIDGITTALSRNQRVALAGFGTWHVTKRRKRNGVNPRTGEAIEIEAKKSVRFKPGKQLVGTLNDR